MALGFLHLGDVCRAVPQACGGAASGCGQPLTAYEVTVLASMKLEAPFTRGIQTPQLPGFSTLCDCDRKTNTRVSALSLCPHLSSLIRQLGDQGTAPQDYRHWPLQVHQDDAPAVQERLP